MEFEVYATVVQRRTFLVTVEAPDEERATAEAKAGLECELSRLSVPSDDEDSHVLSIQKDVWAGPSHEEIICAEPIKKKEMSQLMKEGKSEEANQLLWKSTRKL